MTHLGSGSLDAMDASACLFVSVETVIGHGSSGRMSIQKSLCYAQSAATDRILTF